MKRKEGEVWRKREIHWEGWNEDVVGTKEVEYVR